VAIDSASLLTAGAGSVVLAVGAAGSQQMRLSSRPIGGHNALHGLLLRLASLLDAAAAIRASAAVSTGEQQLATLLALLAVRLPPLAGPACRCCVVRAAAVAALGAGLRLCASAGQAVHQAIGPLAGAAEACYAALLADRGEAQAPGWCLWAKQARCLKQSQPASGLIEAVAGSSAPKVTCNRLAESVPSMLLCLLKSSLPTFAASNQVMCGVMWLACKAVVLDDVRVLLLW
jgi:hypothetical protein